MTGAEPAPVMRWWRGLLVGLHLVLAAASVHADGTWFTVRWVVDGDTIVLGDGRHIRYIGIDAPEVAHRDRPGEPFGEAARSLNRQLVDGRSIRLVLDQERKDRYGRVLAYVYRRDGRFINGEMVRQGLAHVLPMPPNGHHEKLLLHIQQAAMQAGIGIWRAIRRDAAPTDPSIGNLKSRRFHAHDCPMAGRMAQRHRILLENPWQAFWQGFAPARDCIDFPK